ncbi:MAG: VWD domain-containing protein, partial [Pseudomonadota bacterium]
GGGGAGSPTPPPAPPGPEADIFGEPHIVTLDGAYYAFQAAGEFTLVRSTDAERPLDVQVRTAPLGDAVSVITAVAFKMGDQEVMIDATADIRLAIDGVATRFDSSAPILMDDGSQIFADGNGKVFAVLATGEQVMVGLGDGRLDVCVFLDEGRTGMVEGLLGNADGDPNNDLAMPLADGGAVLPQPLDFDTLYGPYAEAWRITDAESLFTYGPGQGTEDFQDRSFPPFAISIEDLPDAVVAEAEAIVDTFGIEDPILRDAAIADVALTGDASFARTAANLAADPQMAVEPDPATIPDAPPMVGIGAPDIQVEEGTSSQPTRVEFILYRLGDLSGTVNVDWAVLDAGVSAQDFAGGVLPSGTVRFNPGETEVKITLDVAADDISELHKYLTVAIDAKNGAGEIIDEVTITLLDDDPDGTFSLAASRSDNTVVMGAADGDLIVTEGELTGAFGIAVDTIEGSGFDDVIDAREAGGRDLTITAGGGDDGVRTRGGEDFIDGGDGDDRIVSSSSRDTVLGGSGDDWMRAGASKDSVDGGSGDDFLRGGKGNDTISGGTGADSIGAGSERDRVFGGFGDDTIVGRQGNDTIFGDAGADIIGGGQDEDSIDGGAGDDSLGGGSNADIILGGSGEDTITGDNGADTLRGGEGDDLIFGGSQADEAHYSGLVADYLIGRDPATGEVVVWHRNPVGIDEGTDTLIDVETLVFQDATISTDQIVTRETPTMLTWGANTFTGTELNETVFAGAGADTVDGGAGSDALFGEAGRDRLDGSRGDDTLDGGVGVDTLTGGAGDDVFILGDLGAADVITDFTVGEDGVRLELGVLVAEDGSVDDSALRLVERNGNTILEAAIGPEDDFIALAELSGVTGASLDEVLINPFS